MAMATWSPPATWQAIDLISDLHLCAAMPNTTQALLRHLRATDADAVLFLGDVFEVWIGDDQAQSAHEASVLAAIAEVGRRRWLGWLHGNRDFLFGSRARSLAGMHLLPDPTVVRAWGSSVLLSHGDALCVGDQDYQRFRAQVRALPWQAEFLAQTWALRDRQARFIRQESRARQRERPDPVDAADVDADQAARWLEDADAHTLVHGHTHRPGGHPLSCGKSRMVLTDWDVEADTSSPRSGVLRWTPRGFDRLQPMAPRPLASGASSPLLHTALP
jgi:UDP-2,3-diacylglucosamine hydrolase